MAGGTILGFVWGVMTILLLLAALRIRARLRERLVPRPLLDDDDVRRIEAEGVFVGEVDEPLDWRDIEEEERRFWEEEEWDPADDW